MQFRTIFLAAAAIAVAAPAFAAGATAPAAPKPPATSFSFEFGSEFTATGVNANKTADTYVKPSFSTTFNTGVIWGGSFQQVWKPAGSQQELLETTLGYNFKIDPTFTITSSAGVGYLWDSAPSSSAYGAYGYYVVNAGLNAKLSPQLTWTVISARYRDAFIGGWQTPKLSTTLSYTWAPGASVFASYGYAWKNGNADKYSVAGGLKIAF